MFQANAAEKIKTHILYPISFFPEIRAVYETMWKNIVVTDRQATDGNIIWRMRFAC